MLLSDISKKQAFLTHLSVSLTIFAVMAWLIYFHWYPSYYFHMDGGYRGIATIFFVDVVLGPGLTLLVFRPGKPNLKFDMAAIIIFQLIALSWGTAKVYGGRPAVTVFYDGKFTCLDQSSIKNVSTDRLDLGRDDNVVLAVLHRPETYDKYLEYSKTAFTRGSSVVYEYGEYFEPMNQRSINHILEFELDVDGQLESIESIKKQYKKIWDTHKHRYGPLSRYRLYPLECRYEKGLAVFNPKTGTIDDVLPIYLDRVESVEPLKINMWPPFDKSDNSTDADTVLLQ